MGARPPYQPDEICNAVKSGDTQKVIAEVNADRQAMTPKDFAAVIDKMTGCANALEDKNRHIEVEKDKDGNVTALNFTDGFLGIGNTTLFKEADYRANLNPHSSLTGLHRILQGVQAKDK